MTYARFSTNQPSANMFAGNFIWCIVCLSACIVQVTSNAIPQQQQRDALPQGNSHDDDSAYDAIRFTARAHLRGNDSPLSLANPNWTSIIQNLVSSFRSKSNALRHGNQFGILYMGFVDESNENNYQCNLQPHDQNGRPSIDERNTLSPSNNESYVNFVYSKPGNISQESKFAHAEINLLDQLSALQIGYQKKFNQLPNTIILYSYIMPCDTCAIRIFLKFQTLPSNFTFKVVGYTDEGLGLPYMTKKKNHKSRERLENNNVKVRKVDIPQVTGVFTPDGLVPAMGQETDGHKRHDNMDRDNYGSSYIDKSYMPLLQDTFQGCMVHCLESDMCCSCTEEGKKSMTAVLVNELTDACALSDIKACADQWIRPALTRDDRRGGASNCTDPDTIASNINVCASKCTGRPFSKPLNPRDPDMYPGRLAAFTDLSDLADVDLTEFCEDIRAEGLLCTVYRSDSFTTGNTRCRKHNVCGYHGYKYSWCYVDWSNHWDYCCTSGCGFLQGTSYELCHSGNTWQYCGA